MKAFVAVLSLAAAALAAPEADPQFVYMNQGVYGSPLVKPLTYAMPQVQYVQPQQVQYVKPAVEYKVVKDEQKTYKPIETVKVEAYSQGEKKFEVPAVSYKQPAVAYTAGFPFAPVSQVAYTQEHIVPAKYHSESAGKVEHTVFKREADPALVYAAGQSVFPYAHPQVYNTVPVANTYAHQFAYTHPVYYNPAQLKTYANDAIKPQNYASKGQYVAQSAGAIHVAKRDAESQYFTPSVYNTVPAVPTVYSGLYNNAAYNGLYNYNTAYNGLYNYNTLGYRYL